MLLSKLQECQTSDARIDTVSLVLIKSSLTAIGYDIHSPDQVLVAFSYAFNGNN